MSEKTIGICNRRFSFPGASFHKTINIVAVEHELEWSDTDISDDEAESEMTSIRIISFTGGQNRNTGNGSNHQNSNGSAASSQVRYHWSK